VKEEERLADLVSRFGERAWTRVSAELGNRSDAQCRYHYRHMVKVRSERIRTSSSEPTAVMGLHLRGICGSKSIGSTRKLLPPIENILRGDAGRKSPTLSSEDLGCDRIE
jgi:hypothetical protein